MNQKSSTFGPYSSADCCGDDCFKWEEENPNNCAGKTTVIDEYYNGEDYWWIHACEVHINDWWY